VAEVGASLVKALRERTGAGIMDCKRALEATGNDLDRAVDWLREKGLASAAKKAGRAASEGAIFSYVHPGARLGVLLELNCETDFVAMTGEFQALGKDLAMHIAAAAPRWVRKEDVPAEVLEHEREVLRRQALAEGKPERIVERMVEGRLQKFYAENCLLEQPFIKDEDKTVGQLVQEAVAKLGENIVPRRFVRFQLGEGAGEAVDGVVRA
jgi:elongation factor Ts